MGRELRIRWCGRVPYRDGLALQERLVEERRTGRGRDRLLLLEHPPVVTLGRRADPAHLRVSDEELRHRGVEVHRIARGGDVTYHGPGQLVGYLIVDLQEGGRPDVIAFLRWIEDTLADALRELGVEAVARPGYTGLFVPRPRGPLAKIASIGIGVRGWVTYHGFALNVGADLTGFEWIVPCGLHGVSMTSVARERGGEDPGLRRAGQAVAAAFARGFPGGLGQEAA